MGTSRREFMKLFGTSVAALLLTHCKWNSKVEPSEIVPVCYTATPPAFTPGSLPSTARTRLRRCWLSFGELAHRTTDESNAGSTEDAFGQQLIREHRTALDELVTAGELTAAVAALVQEAYAAAVYHVWRSNAMITCYEPVIVDYAPASAEVLVQQSEALGQLSGRETVDPQTLAKAQAAIQHDMAFYALTDEEVQALYARILEDQQGAGQSVPSFEAVTLDATPDARAAARFIVDLLANSGRQP